MRRIRPPHSPRHTEVVRTVGEKIPSTLVRARRREPRNLDKTTKKNIAFKAYSTTTLFRTELMTFQVTKILSGYQPAISPRIVSSTIQ